MSKEEKDLIKLEYMGWLEQMALRYGCTSHEIGKLILEYEKRLEVLYHI